MPYMDAGIRAKEPFALLIVREDRLLSYGTSRMVAIACCRGLA